MIRPQELFRPSRLIMPIEEAAQLLDMPVKELKQRLDEEKKERSKMGMKMPTPKKNSDTERTVTYVWWVLGSSREDVFFRLAKHGPFAHGLFPWLFNSREIAESYIEQGKDPAGFVIPKEYKAVRLILHGSVDLADAPLPKGFGWMRGKQYNQWEGKGKLFPGR